MKLDHSSSLLIVGAGNMGQALVRGLRERCPCTFGLRLYDVHRERLDRLRQDTGVAVTVDLEEQPLTEEAVILCVKPQDLGAVAGKLRPVLKPKKTLIISILAGTTVSDLESAFAHKGPVVRCMPNIAATVGAAATAMCQNGILSDQQVELVETIFNSIGKSWWLKESLLDAVTGLSGSGPAYLYMVIEALTDGGVKMGIPRKIAAQMAVQTVLGSALLVQETSLHPAILKDQVTTPGGTTITAIHELEERGLRAMLIHAVESATRQSKNLRNSS